MDKISNEELENIAAQYEGRTFFAKALEHADIFKTLTSYIAFNAVFAGSVLKLAGRLANERIFKEGPLDASHDVAAYVFNAAIDEFKHPIHRRLAQQTLLETGEYVGVKSLDLRKDLVVCCDVASKYDDKNLFKAIGFHLGSEFFADQEFNTLDQVITKNHPGLVAHLKKHKAYAWIAIHTIVEKDHFNNALSAANAALEYQIGERYQKSDILSGFSTFGKTQQDFMESLWKQ